VWGSVGEASRRVRGSKGAGGWQDEDQQSQQGSSSSEDLNGSHGRFVSDRPRVQSILGAVV